jgi:hypothetical protein
MRLPNARMQFALQEVKNTFSTDSSAQRHFSSKANKFVKEERLGTGLEINIELIAEGRKIYSTPLGYFAMTLSWNVFRALK